MQSSPTQDSQKRKLPYGWLLAGLILIGGMGIFLSSKRQTDSGFGRIREIHSFKPEATATAYESKNGNATILWLSGLDEYASEFGQIWQVYSFKPEVVATSYDSPTGNATIIWLSGMDDEEDSDERTSS